MTYSRDEFKRVLLKRVLFRIDYRQLLEIELEKILSDIKTELDDYFMSYDVKTIKQVDFNIDIDEVNINKQEDMMIHIFSFKDKNKHFELAIHNQMVNLQVFPVGDPDGTDYYYKIFAMVIDIISRTKLFRINRFGLRKFNQFFIYGDQLDKLDEIFVNEYLQIWNSGEFTKKQLQDCYEKEAYKYNTSREIQKGIMKIEGNNTDVYLVLFDFDVYITESEQLEVLVNNSENRLKEINDIIFELFISSLKTDFIENTLKKGYTPDFILNGGM